MDEESQHMKGRINSNRDKEPVHPPPPPPPPLPACSHHGNVINRVPSVRSIEDPSISVIPEEIKDSPTRRPYFNTLNFERPRLIRRDRNKVCRLYSGMYARLIIVFTVAFVLNEILNKTFSPYFFQGFLFLYLFGGSVLCMMIIYCCLLRVKIEQTKDSLKRQKTGIPEISVYLRIGVLIFGLGTLLFNGLEVAIVFMTERKCTNIPGMALPVLQAFFTFVQMHFIFTDTRKALKKLGWFGWFAMSHLAATNMAVWVRIVVMETANDWMHHLPYFIEDELELHQHQHSDVFLNSTVSDANLHTMDDAMKLFICLQNSTLGNMWEETMPYLYPFIIKFSWLGYAIFYTIRSSLQNRSSSSHSSSDSDHFSVMTRKRKPEMDSYKSSFTKTGRRYYFRIDCRGSSKGLFAGLFLLIGNIIVIVLFYVLRTKEEYEQHIYLAALGTYGAMLLFGIIGVTVGYFVIKNGLSESFHRKSKIDDILSSVSLTGLCLLCAFSLIVSGTDITEPLKMVIVANNCLTIIQATLQEMFIAEMSCRKSIEDSDLCLLTMPRPGRQMTTFLVFINIILWLFDTFVTYIILLHTNHMHAIFMASFPWGIIFRVSFPLLIFYRFHSAVRLASLWKTTYEH